MSRRAKRFTLVSLVLLILAAAGTLIAARYDKTVRIVDAAGNIMSGTASGVTGFYDETVRVVDAAGNVLNSMGAATSGSGTLGDVAAGGPNGTLGGTGQNGADGFSINGNYTVTAPQFGAVAGASAPVRHTLTTNGSTTVALDSADSDMSNGESLMAFGAGAACSIGGTACSGITAPTPTVTVNGYNGANAGASTTYGYEIAACDVAFGCTAAGVASTGAVAAQVLTEPNEAGSTGNNLALSWTAVTGAAHYAIWRTTNGGSTWLYWAVVDTNSFTDWYNHQTVSTTSGPFTNTPLAAVLNDTYVGQIVSGAGTASLVMNSAPAQTGSGFVAFRDDTPGIQAAITAAAVRGGKVTLPPGKYKVRALVNATGVNIEGAWAGGNAFASVLNGTSGYDVIGFSTPTPNNSYLNFAIIGGRSAFATPVNSATYQYLDNLFLGSEFAQIYISSSNEEWYGRNVYFSGGQYGIDVEGPSHYLQKSSFYNSTFNGQQVNAIRVSTTVTITGYLTFDRMIEQGIKQDGIWLNAPNSSITLSGVTDEGMGGDFVRTTTVPASNAVTCTSGSNVINVANTTGFAFGQDATVYGCGTNGLPLEGTICALTTNTSITLQDPTCTTAVNAGTTQATSQTLTNAIFDNMYLGVVSSVINNRISNSSIASSGGCCGGTQTRYNLWTPGGGWFIDTAVVVRDDASTDNIRYAITWLRQNIASLNLVSGQLDMPSTADSSKSGNFSLLNSPQGGDVNIGLIDAAGTGVGPWTNAFRVRINSSSRVQVASIDGAGTFNWLGSLEPHTTTDTYGATVNTDLTKGSFVSITVTDGNAWTLANPISATFAPAMFWIYLSNTSGGAMGTISLGTQWKTDTSWGAPATGKHRLCQGHEQSASLYYIGPCSADIAN